MKKPIVVRFPGYGEKGEVVLVRPNAVEDIQGDDKHCYITCHHGAVRYVECGAEEAAKKLGFTIK